MSKKHKKDKGFSYNNTHGHGVYPPFPPYGQRYPHTDLHQIPDPTKWLMEQMGILKDWLLSLTKLFNMFAQLETDDIDKLVDEIIDLISHIQAIFNNLADYLNNWYQAQVLYDVNLIEDLKWDATIYENLIDFINNITPKMEDLFNCIENRLSVIDESTYNNIENINNNIENIYNILEAQYSSKSTTLKYGTDYTITFFNSFKFTNDEQTPNVSISTTKFNDYNMYSIKLQNGSEINGHAITNDYTYTSSSSSDSNAPIFRHSTGWAAAPQSWIYLIKFIGNYAFLNDLSSTGYLEHSEDCVWNMRPVSARPTWQVNLAAGLVDAVSSDGSINAGRGILLNMVNISDGFNSQYYTYINYGLADTVYFGDNLNINLDVYIS